jgi:hypothetical protein
VVRVENAFEPEDRIGNGILVAQTGLHAGDDMLVTEKAGNRVVIVEQIALKPLQNVIERRRLGLLGKSRAQGNPSPEHCSRSPLHA